MFSPVPQDRGPLVFIFAILDVTFLIASDEQPKIPPE